MCQRYGIAPSDKWRLVDHGIPEAVAYDFDLAVATLAATMDTRLKETEQVEVQDGPRPSKGHHFEQRPKYTFRDLIVETMGDDGGADGLPDVFANLPAALLT